eukprot:TRINITY_DN16469_c0_g1_i3.p1 TRINITY_DN16469_c0_g1~~TRINITY_DN16469_c0_g1_i3.p1  ORF type:complete len:1065 (-),score=254.94 TRINITY_DN16469_c0_g1_i3:64-3258(-)
MLVPSMLREINDSADLKIGWFLHTPFPSSEIYRTLPKRKEILRGVIGADLIGFQIYDYGRHFMSAVSRLLGTEVTQDNKYMFDTVNRRTILVDAFPIGIDPNQWNDALCMPDVKDMIINLQRRFDGKRIILGLDRLDYVKGIPHKLLAMEHFLDCHPEWVGKVVLVQIAVPSRGSINGYRQLADQVHKLVGRINGKHGTLEDVPIHYLDQHIEHDRLAAMYALADVALVTSLRDGMNLVSFEYVACQEETCGVLILSELAGAAQGLGAGALLVNPFNIDEMSTAIFDGLNMPKGEREERHEYLHQYISKYTAQNWANNFLSELKNLKDFNGEEFDAAESDQEPIPLNPTIQRQILRDYRKGTKRLLIFGMVDCLLSFQDFRARGMLDEDTHEALRILSDDPRNTVVVMSGRERAVLDGFLGMLPVWLVAENGLFYRFGGREMEWQALEDEELDTTWADSVKPVFKYFEERTPNTFLEVKECSITWHYKEAEEGFAELQASDLTMHVEKVLSNVPVEVSMHQHKVEVRPHGISKGDMLEFILEEIGYHVAGAVEVRDDSGREDEAPTTTSDDARRKQRLQSYLGRKKHDAEAALITQQEEAMSVASAPDLDPLDFVLCIGNFAARDDEIFANLTNEDYEYRHKLAPLEKTYCIKVSHIHSPAQYSVPSIDDVDPFLANLANVAKSSEGVVSAAVSDSEDQPTESETGPIVLENALEKFQEIRDFCSQKQVAFFLDYDGTLTPIVSSPELATLSEEAREVVRNLAQKFPTAIVTGRTKATAHGFVQIDDLWYAGSHGFDIGRGLSDFGYSVASSYQPALLEAQEELQKRLGEISGMLIEDNTFSISVHYRNVSETDRPVVEAAVMEVLSTRPMLRKTDGKMVYELRPSVDWHKGKAVEWLLEVITDDFPNMEIVPIYIGDDVTDEDAFRVLGPLGGIGIFVGDQPNAGDTEATYYVEDPFQVKELLNKFVEMAPLCTKRNTPPQRAKSATSSPQTLPSDVLMLKKGLVNDSLTLGSAVIPTKASRSPLLKSFEPPRSGKNATADALDELLLGPAADSFHRPPAQPR